MLLKKKIPKSTLYIIAYIVVCAISHVFVNHTTRTVAPAVSLFYAALFTIVFFSILHIKTLKQSVVLIQKHKKSIFWLNLLNAIIWFVAFFSLQVLSPSVFACLFLGAIPINLFILQLITPQKEKQNNLRIGMALFVMFCIMLCLVGLDIEATTSYNVIIYGCIVVFLGGITAAFVMKISKKLATKKVPASLVVALRFYGLLVISFLWVAINYEDFFIGPLLLLKLFLVAMVSMALPLFLLQKALETINTLYASILIAFIPVLTYFLQLATGYYLFSLLKLGITLLFCISLIVLAYYKKKQK